MSSRLYTHIVSDDPHNNSVAQTVFTRFSEVTMLITIFTSSVRIFLQLKQIVHLDTRKVRMDTGDSPLGRSSNRMNLTFCDLAFIGLRTTHEGDYVINLSGASLIDCRCSLISCSPSFTDKSC